MKANIPKLAVSIMACELAGIIGSAFTVSAIPTWYAQLSKPSFSPPNWLFAPVWTLLYFLIGVSLYLVWSKGLKAKGARKAIVLFYFQLLLNVLWSIAFFGLKSPFIGFLIIALLWFAILTTIVRIYNVDKKAAWLLVPYILWVSFAGVLNFTVMLLN